jgi:pilus assembly protein Flp/PilA
MKRVENNNERGATMVEYAVMVALIAAVVLVAVRTLGTNIKTQMSDVAGQVN